MKKKHIRKFIALFDFLPLAGEMLSGVNNPEQDSDLKISSALQSVRELRNDPANRFMIEVFDEIDHNLYHLPDSRMEFYVEDLLRGFAGVSPFLYYPPGTPWPENLTANVPQNELQRSCMATLRLLSGLEKETDIDDDGLSDAAKYVYSCYDLLHFFSKSFDARCLHFKLDLCEIQDRLGIYIFFDRDYNDLINAGYWDKVLEEVSKDETPPKALAEHASRERPEIKPFHEWLINHKKPEKLAVICKYLFDDKHSPKDYAIMLCLLHQNGFIHLHEKHRSDFYNSWYVYIGKSISEKPNYWAINKHIDTNGGFQIIADDKPYYQNKKELFDWKLQQSARM